MSLTSRGIEQTGRDGVVRRTAFATKEAPNGL